MERFYTCSYGELTDMVSYRVREIRKIRKFIKEVNFDNYSSIRIKLHLSLIGMYYEIRFLLRMRRTLKKSGKRNYQEYAYSIKDYKKVPLNFSDLVVTGSDWVCKTSHKEKYGKTATIVGILPDTLKIGDGTVTLRYEGGEIEDINYMDFCRHYECISDYVLQGVEG